MSEPNLNERVAKLEQLVLNMGDWVRETKDTLKSIEVHIRQSIEFQQEQKHMITQQANMSLEMNRINTIIIEHQKEDDKLHTQFREFMVELNGVVGQWTRSAQGWRKNISAIVVGVTVGVIVSVLTIVISKSLL